MNSARSKQFFSPEKIYYLYSGSFAFFFAMMATIFALYHIQSVGMNPFQLVLVGAVLEASCFIFEVPTGVVADRTSRKWPVILGLFVMGMGILLEGLFPVFGVVLLAQIVWGLGATFLSGADTAWLNDETQGQNMGKMLLKGAQLRQLFTFLGTLFTIPLATISLNLPILVCGGGLLATALLLVRFMPEHHFSPTHDMNQGLLTGMADSTRKGATLIFKNKRLVILFWATLFGGLYNEGFDRLWTLHILNGVGFPVWPQASAIIWFSAISMAGSLVGILALKMVGRQLKRTQADLVLLTIHGALFASVLGFALCKQFWLAIGLYLLSRSFRVSMAPLFDLQINREISDSCCRATILSMRGQLDQLGQIVGGPALGFIAAQYSVPLGLTIAALMLAPSIPLLFKKKALQEGLEQVNT